MWRDAHAGAGPIIDDELTLDQFFGNRRGLVIPNRDCATAPRRIFRAGYSKAGFLRKTGPPNSDRATMTSRFYRHGDILTVLVVLEDPIYLAEPHVMTKSFQLQTAPISPIGPPCVSGFEGRQPGESVPHYLPEKNPFVDEMTKLFHIPREAVLGEPETLYPEYRKKIRSTYVRPEPCKQNCGIIPAR